MQEERHNMQIMDIYCRLLMILPRFIILFIQFNATYKRGKTVMYKSKQTA